MFEDRVTAGAAFLDDHFGDGEWRRRISLDRLSMTEADRCIIGQLFGDYWDAWDAIEGFGWGATWLDRDFGFTLTGSDEDNFLVDHEATFPPSAWEHLGDLWRAEITAWLEANPEN